MSEPMAIETTSPTTGQVIKLWTPKNIFWLGFFLGWPTALVLCIINWFRMGLRKKGFVFIGGGLVALVLFFTANSAFPGNSSTLPLFILNLLLLASLQSLMNTDLMILGYPNANYRQAGIGLGILIGILTLVIIFGGTFIIVIIIELVKIILAPASPLPGQQGLRDILIVSEFHRCFPV